MLFKPRANKTYIDITHPHDVLNFLVKEVNIDQQFIRIELANVHWPFLYIHKLQISMNQI